MQSHLEAALLGQPSDSNVASSIEDDEKDFREDDADDDFIDEVLFFSAYICISLTCSFRFAFHCFYVHVIYVNAY